MDKDRIVGTTQNIAGKVQAEAGRLAGSGSNQAEGLVREAVGTAQDIYGQTKDNVREIGEAATGMARDVYRDGSDAVAGRVKDNPLGALLMAGAFGFALGMMLARPAPRRRRYSL
jgi:uncharacterized protein YjbJ (UPF0337 family)